jgi:hypothetical protein
VPLVPGRHQVLRIAALSVGAVLFVLGSLTTPSLAATRSSDADTLTLVAQSNDVIGSGKLSLAVSVRADLPTKDLRVEVTLFPKLENRSEFNSTTQNIEPAGSSCLSETGPMKLTTNSGDADGITRFKLAVETAGGSGPCAQAGTTLTLECTLGSCGGVYPIEVALIDRKTDATIRFFTTHLVELDSASVSSPLNVGLVISLGSTLALGPSGASTLTSSQISALSDTLATIASYPSLHLTLLIYPQLVAALKATHPTPTRLISRLHRLVATRSAADSIELLGAPFTPVDTSALAAGGSGAIFDQLLNLGKATSSAEFGGQSSNDTYLAPAPLTSGGAKIVAAQCADQLILPSGSASPPTDGLSQTAPLSLTLSPKSCETGAETSSPAPVEAFVTDPASGLLTSKDGAPVLAAHQLLADLAQIYFEQPNATPRSVVLNTNGSIDAELLNVVLNGLNSDAYLHPTTIDSLFSITPVAAAGSTATLTLGSQALSSDQIATKELAEANHELAVATSVVPSDATLLATLSEDLILAHSYGLSGGDVAKYLDAPSRQLDAVARTLSFPGTRHFTLTAATGRLPITIQQAANIGPIYVRIRLESSNLVVLPGSSSSNVTELKADATTLTDARVQVVGSGTSTLNVDVLSPTGDQVLLSGQFSIHTTAISAVAIAISVLSLVILAAWWIRSARKKHRAKAQAILQP